MFKFQFVRLEENEGPTWNSNSIDFPNLPTIDFPNSSDDDPLLPLWQSIWNRLRANPETFPLQDHSDIPNSIQDQLFDITADAEPQRVNAAFTLAKYGQKGVSYLIHALKKPEQCISRTAGFGLTAAHVDAVPELLRLLKSDEQYVIDAVIVFARMGLHKAPSAVKPLLQLAKKTKGGDIKLKRSVAEALGTISIKDPFFDDCVRTLSDLTTHDSDDQVRFQACLSLIMLAKAAGNTVIETLETALNDSNRYVRGYALHGLTLIGTSESKDVLIRALWKAQWCYLTTPQCPF